MKRILAPILILILLLNSVAVVAENSWICPTCSKEATGNFCPYCGTQNLYISVCPTCYNAYPLELKYTFCSKCGTLLPTAINKEYVVGNCVTFGTYPQASAGNDSTPIEWLVLARENTKVLMISKYCLDAKPFNTENTEINWENSSLRHWLNNDFLNHAFTSEEQSVILLTTVDNSKNQIENYTGGICNDTLDKVFLLSYREAHELLDGNEKRAAAPTDYAISQGAVISYERFDDDGRSLGVWWTRTSHYKYMDAFCIMDYGSISVGSVDALPVSVRPVIWIDLGTSYFVP